MGIKGLSKLLGDSAPSCIKQQELKSYFGRIIAIDASMNIYQFLSAVRTGADNLRNEAGEITSHLSGLFYRTTRLMELGIKPCYVFDGKPPEMKSSELSKRLEARKQAEASAELAKEEGDIEAYEKFNKRVNKVSPQVTEQSKRLLKVMGIPVIEAPGEAEAQCAILCKEGLVYATASEDMDSLTFGSSKVIRQLWVGATSTAEKKGLRPLEFSLDKALEELQLSYEQFIDLCILCGCDYMDSIKGIGPHKALTLIRKHHNLEAALAEIKEKYNIPEYFPYDEVRKLFKNPTVLSPSSIELKWSLPDEEGIIQMLVHEFNFNEENIRKALKRLTNAKDASSQGRLENFFSIKPSKDSSSSKKRKTSATVHVQAYFEVMEPSNSPLVIVGVGSEGIELGEMTANDLSVLRPFLVQNTSSSKLRVKLSSDLGNRVKYQLENENLCREFIGEGEFSSEEYNQVFNECGFIEEVDLEPFSSTQIVLNFTPRSKLGLQNNFVLQRELLEAFLEGKGRQNFLARYSLEYLEGYLWLEVIAAWESNETYKASSQEDLYSRESFVQSYPPLMVKVSGHLCPSVLLPDLHEILFDNCITGTTYVRDLTIWNLSEIPTNFNFTLTYLDRISLDGKSNYRMTCGAVNNEWIYICDYETGLKLEDVVEVPGFSYRRLQVIFRATVEGETNYYFELENRKDLRNCFTIKISTVVTGELPKDTLEIAGVPNGFLDFGDCYYEDSVPREIVIKNVSKNELEVSLGSDRKDQIVYELVNDDDNVVGMNVDNSSDVDGYSSLKKSGKAETVEIMSSDGSETKRSSALATPERIATPEKQFLSFFETNEHHVIDMTGRVDELAIPAGQEKKIRVIFTPKRPSNEFLQPAMMFSMKETLCKLMTHTFRLFFRSRLVGSKSISCRARVCESLISVEPKEINLGECDIQSLYHTNTTISNLSELPATLSLRYTSKAVFIEPVEISIPPKRSHVVSIQYIPRTVTPDYKKQIRIINRKNRSNDCVIVLKANNIDRHRVVFHAKFYELLTDTTTNQIDFGVTVVGHPALRTFRLRNITNASLTLEFKSNSEVSVYSVASKDTLYEKAARGTGSIERDHEELILWRREAEIYKKKLSLVENLDEYSRKVSNTGDNGGKNMSEEKNINLLEKGEGESVKSEKTLTYRQEELEKRIQRLVELASPSRRTPTYFSDAGAELDYIENQLRAGRELARALRDGLLVPVRQIELEAAQEQTFFMTFVPDTKKRSLKGKLRPIESILSIHIVKFCGTLPVDCIEAGITDVSQISAREALLFLKACKSEMELAQKHIHFGHMNVGEQRTKSLLIQNRCEAPLLYVIKKSGSVSSDDLQFDNSKVGVIRPYSSKEIAFKFKPGMAGPFQETVFIENLLDSSSDETVTIKATVHKKSHFHVESLCDSLIVSKETGISTVGYFLLCNDSDKSREFVVESETYTDGIPVTSFCVVEQSNELSSLQETLREQKLTLEEWNTFCSKTVPIASRLRVTVKARTTEHVIYWISYPNTISKLAEVSNENEKLELVVFESKDRDTEKIIQVSLTFDKLQQYNMTPVLLTKEGGREVSIREQQRKEEPLFLIEASRVDLGSVFLGQVIQHPIKLFSLCDEETIFLQVVAAENTKNVKGQRSIDASCNVALVEKDQMDSECCEVAARGTVLLKIEACPRTTRRMWYTFYIQANTAKGCFYRIPLEVGFVGYSKDSIRVLEVQDEESLHPFCTVADSSRKYAWIYHLHIVCDIQNCVSAVLSAKSNLPSQIFIFCDDKLETIAENIPIQPNVPIELFLCIAPKFTEDDILFCRSKRIIAGLQLSIIDQESSIVISERTWKLQGIVGIIRLKTVIPENETFSIVYCNGNENVEWEGHVQVINESLDFSTTYRIVCPYRDIQLHEPFQGVLGCCHVTNMNESDRQLDSFFPEQYSVEQRETAKYPNGVKVIYSFCPYKSGYFARKLFIETPSLSHPAEACFACFVDDDLCQLHSQYYQEQKRNIRFPISVCRRGNNNFQISQVQSFSFSLRLLKKLAIENITLLSTFVNFTDDNNDKALECVQLPGWNASLYPCNRSAVSRLTNLAWNFEVQHSMHLHLEKNELQSFLTGQNVLERHGYLVLSDAQLTHQDYIAESAVLKILSCSLFYECPKISLLSENPVWIGDIGPLSGIMEQTVSFVLHNESEFSVKGCFEHFPTGIFPMFSLLDDEMQTVEFLPYEKKVFMFRIVSQALDISLSGKVRLNISFKNTMDDSNEFELVIKANYLRAHLQSSEPAFVLDTVKYPNGEPLEKELMITNTSCVGLLVKTNVQWNAEWTRDSIPIQLELEDAENGTEWNIRRHVGAGESLHLVVKASPLLSSPWSLLEMIKEEPLKESQDTVVGDFEHLTELGVLNVIPQQDVDAAVSIPIYFSFELDAFLLYNPLKLVIDHPSNVKRTVYFMNPWTAAAFDCRLESISLPPFVQLASPVEEFSVKPASHMEFPFKLKLDASLASLATNSSWSPESQFSLIFTVSIADDIFSKLTPDQQNFLLTSSWEWENLFRIVIPIEFSPSFFQKLFDFPSRQPSSSPVESNVRISSPLDWLNQTRDGNNLPLQTQQHLDEREIRPQIILRGFTCIATTNQGNRYELDIGQVFVGKDPSSWTFTVESSCARTPLHYQISVVTMEDEEHSWITLSQQEGWLDETEPSQSIQAYFSTFRMGYFHGYLRLENVSNPSNILVVRVNMQVVAQLDPEEEVRKQVFSVVCDARRHNRQNMVDYSVVFFDHIYRHRSFVITNHSSVEQEFLLRHDMHPESKSELNFSLTNNTLRKVNALHIKPGESCRVFLYYRPTLESTDVLNLVDIEDYNKQEITREYHVFINCRLVKNYQEVILVTSRCRLPRLKLSLIDQMFALRLSTTEMSHSYHGGDLLSKAMKTCQASSRLLSGQHHLDTISTNIVTVNLNNEIYTIEPSLCVLYIRNLSPATKLQYSIRNATYFFEVENNHQDNVIPPAATTHLSCRGDSTTDNTSSCHTVTLRLNVKALCENQKTVLKEKYLEEHISIYNCDLPKEFFWLRLRVSVDGTAKNFSAVMQKGTYAFETLESVVQNFMQQVGEYFQRLHLKLSNEADEFLRSNYASRPPSHNNTEQDEMNHELCRFLRSQLEEWVLQEKHRQLLFEMHYVTDELTYCALKDPSDTALLLAKLAYSFIFQHPLFRWLRECRSTLPELKRNSFVASWTGQLRHFLSFFPDKYEKLQLLFSLEEQLET